MTVARTWAVSLTGLDGRLVEVEADLTQHTPEFRLIGLPDKALGEAVRRVQNACENSGLPMPNRRLTVNLSPANLPKQGSGFDVAIAVAGLATGGLIDAASVARTVHIGELGLDGRLRPVPGVLPAVHAAVRAGKPRVVVPRANREEAELVAGAEVHAAATFAEVACWHGTDAIELSEPDAATPPHTGPVAIAAEEAPPDLADVVGQPEAVDALVIAAAGGHHVVMSGPPGAGKTMLARRLPGLLPPLSDSAALEVAALRSVAGEAVRALPREAPFEAPHHSASLAALVGGGSRVASPGAIARASHGVLFLDEACESPRAVLDALRQPLEEGRIEIHRAGFRAAYPARFQLVLATNPCPCGEFGVPGGTCTCAPSAIRRYAGRLSGPLLDRIDIDLRLRRVSRLPSSRSGITTATAREQVVRARERAAHRLRETPWRTNARVSGAWLRQGPHPVDAAARRTLDAALHRGTLTLRGYDRVLRLAWTIADLAERDVPNAVDVGRALLLKKGIGS